MSEMPAHRPEQQPEHTSSGTATDDEQIGVNLTQSAPSVAMQHLPHQLDTLVSRKCCEPGELMAYEGVGAAVVAGQPGVDRGRRWPPRM
jgi:hypothetical protein